MTRRQSARTVSKNRLFTWMMIGTIFFLIDMAILFYFLRPREPAQKSEQPAAVSTLQQGPVSGTSQTEQSVKK